MTIRDKIENTKMGEKVQLIVRLICKYKRP